MWFMHIFIDITEPQQAESSDLICCQGSDCETHISTHTSTFGCSG